MSLLLLDTMIATERLYDSSVRAFKNLSFRKEEAVVSDTDNLAEETALLRLLVGGTNDRVPTYNYNSDDEEEFQEISSQDLVTLIQQRLKEKKAEEEAEQSRALSNKEPSKFELLCSHEQYGLDMCMFLLSPNSPLYCHSPNPAEEDAVVEENDTNDDDEAWFGIDCGKDFCGKYALQADEKTAATDGSTTISGSNGDSTIDSSEDEESLPLQSRGLATSSASGNALTEHLKSLIAKNKGANGDHCEGLDINHQSFLSGEIRVPTALQPEPVGRSMTQPSDDDYLMLIQGDPKGTSFCTDDSSVDEAESEIDEIRSSDSMHMEPDGATLAPMDEVSVKSEVSVVHDTKTNNIEMIRMDLVAADMPLHETGSVSSSKMSERALLDDDHDSVLEEDDLELFREPDGTKYTDGIVLPSRIMKEKPRVLPVTKPVVVAAPVAKVPSTQEENVEVMSDDEHTEVFSEPFDETEDNRVSPRQQIRKEITAVDGAHCSFELPASRRPKTNLQKRLNLLERLRGLSDNETDMLCACVQGCGDFADGTFFEEQGDEASRDESETAEQLSLD